MEKVIKVDGKDIAFKATASTLRLYRARFGRDMLLDFARLEANMQEVAKANLEAEETGLELKSLSIDSLETFENIAYIMAKQADSDIPDNPGDWLDEFSMFSIYTILPQIVELWKISELPTATSKKKA